MGIVGHVLEQPVERQDLWPTRFLGLVAMNDSLLVRGREPASHLEMA
jgi:hypothetical protein